MSIEIKSNKFLKYVKNTIEDLNKNNYDEIEFLYNIYNTKALTLQNAETLYTIIHIRKQNLEYAKTMQDEYSFVLINKEHRYMEKYLNKYFKFDVLNYSETNIQAVISLKIK